MIKVFNFIIAVGVGIVIARAATYWHVLIGTESVGAVVMVVMFVLGIYVTFKILNRINRIQDVLLRCIAQVVVLMLFIILIYPKPMEKIVEYPYRNNHTQVIEDRCFGVFFFKNVSPQPELNTPWPGRCYGLVRTYQ